jgi:hypothetical protein
MRGVITSILMLSLNSVAVAGPLDFYPEKLQVWKNKDCRANQTCDLKAVRMSVQRWRADYTPRYGEGAYNFGDTMTFSYETKTAAGLEKYAMVQYVKGCVYGSFVRDGKVRNFFSYARFSHNATLREHTSIWMQKDWIIDSDDKDPVYNSPFPEDYQTMKRPSRHGLYRWNSMRNFDTNQVPTSQEASTERYYGQSAPQNNKLYVTDRPGTAFTGYQIVDGENIHTAKNISLDFRACLYKIEDIPLSVDDMGDKVFIENPVKCFDWKSRNVYNWDKKQYETPEAMSEACTKYDL